MAILTWVTHVVSHPSQQKTLWFVFPAIKLETCARKKERKGEKFSREREKGKHRKKRNNNEDITRFFFELRENLVSFLSFYNFLPLNKVTNT